MKPKFLMVRIKEPMASEIRQFCKKLEKSDPTGRRASRNWLANLAMEKGLPEAKRLLFDVS